MLNSLSGVVRRTRQHHAVEHATLHLLAARLPNRRFGGYSDPLGFTIVGEATTEELQHAVGDALLRLQAGERGLAIHPNCGTNLLAAGATVTAASMFGSAVVRGRLERTTHAFQASETGVDAALSGRARIWGAALCMAREHPVNGVGARNFRDAFPACDPEPEEVPAWGAGPAFHAHQIVLEILSETGGIGLLLWLAGAALAWRAWRYADAQARARARPAMLALAVTVFPFNTHLAFYSTFWGGVTLLLAALYAGSLLAGRQPAAAPAR